VRSALDRELNGRLDGDEILARTDAAGAKRTPTPMGSTP
jgi:hypothetical protein